MSLLSPDWEHKRLPAQLAREQIRTSPDVLSHPEVSRALESELLSYYGYPFYWAGDARWGPVSNPALAAEQAGALPSPPAPSGQRIETRLRSCMDLIGCAVHARDGELGHLNDLMLDTTAWAIERLNVEPIRRQAEPLAISPRSVTRLDWTARTLRIDLSRRTLLTSEEQVRRANGALTGDR